MVIAHVQDTRDGDQHVVFAYLVVRVVRIVGVVVRIVVAVVAAPLPVPPAPATSRALLVIMFLAAGGQLNVFYLLRFIR